MNVIVLFTKGKNIPYTNYTYVCECRAGVVERKLYTQIAHTSKNVIAHVKRDVCISAPRRGGGGFFCRTFQWGINFVTFCGRHFSLHLAIDIRLSIHL